MKGLQLLPLSRIPGAEYVQWVLAHGHGLSTAALELSGFPDGEFFALLREAEVSGDLLSFQAGGKLAQGPRFQSDHNPSTTLAAIPDSFSAFTSFAAGFLSREPHGGIVIENWLARRSDPASQMLRSRIRTSGEAIYHWLPSPASEDQGSIRVALEEAFSTPVFATFFLADAGELFTDHSSSEIDRKELESLAAAIVWIVVGAYDGEGFVAWRRGA